MGLRAVLDHGDAVGAPYGQDGVHVARVAEQVHDHDRAGPRRDLALDVFRIDVEGIRVHVCEHGDSVLQDDPAHRSYRRDGRGDHLVAGLRVDGGDGGMARAGPGVDRLGMLDAVLFGKCLLKGLDLYPVTPAVGLGVFDNLDQLALVFFAKEPLRAEGARAQRPAPVNGQLLLDVRRSHRNLPEVVSGGGRVVVRYLLHRGSYVAGVVLGV